MVEYKHASPIQLHKARLTRTASDDSVVVVKVVFVDIAYSKRKESREQIKIAEKDTTITKTDHV